MDHIDNFHQSDLVAYYALFSVLPPHAHTDVLVGNVGVWTGGNAHWGVCGITQ